MHPTLAPLSHTSRKSSCVPSRLFLNEAQLSPSRFELYERNHGRGKSDKEYSIKLSLSEGAHSSNVLDSALDARHSLNVQPRRKLTQHLPYPLVIERLSKHFGRVADDDDTGPDAPYETLDALRATVAATAPADDP